VERHGIPPQRFLKLNFDRVSRGNPGPGGVEGIFRDSKGEIISLYTIVLGHTTINRDKLAGLLAGLQWTKVRGYSTLNIEGDSKLLVSTLGKIINGASPDKVSKDWARGGGTNHPWHVSNNPKSRQEMGKCGRSLPF
jgi:ribonuclease HI